MSSGVTPVFVLSLPRSGSTLVQRVLSAHPDVASHAEPWLLLPSLYAMRPDGVFAEYDHAFARHGLREFVGSLPGGDEDYFEAVGRMATSLYARAAVDGESVFVDKTPRYSLVADELARAFPDAPIIVLWRNPLAIAASIVETWGGGRWNVYKFKIDLYTALSRLVDFQRRNSERVLSIRYEDLVLDSDRSWPRIFRHAGLSYDPSFLESFTSTRLGGTMGDPTGQTAYASLSRDPLGKWPQSFASPVRKRWARRYLQWIGQTRLEAMAYDVATLLRELDSVPSRADTLVSDVWFSLYGVLHHLGELKQVRLKTRRLRSWPDVHAHR